MSYKTIVSHLAIEEEKDEATAGSTSGERGLSKVHSVCDEIRGRPGVHAGGCQKRSADGSLYMKQRPD